MALPWKLHGDGKNVSSDEIILPEERLTWWRTIGFGGQHVVAMFGATFLVPIITGFPPATTLLFSGIGTLLFLIITANKLPSYVGSSFAFIAPILAATASGGRGVALGGIIVTGAVLALVGVLVHVVGTKWIDKLLPAVVSGSIVALIGFALAPTAQDNFAKSPWVALITLFAVIFCAVIFRGFLGRLSILVGVVIGYIAAWLSGEVDFSQIESAAWIGFPEFITPVFDMQYLPIYLMFLPVVLALVAENVGHIKGVGQLIDRNLDPLTGRALFADGFATVIAGFGGGSPTTTYGENIGVMAATKIFSTAAYWVAGITAILLGLSPKVGAVINTIPPGVIGGVTTALYGLIGIIGIRIWVENKVDFSRPKNQMTAGVALVMGIANYTLAFGEVKFEGIILGTVASVVIYHLMSVIGKLRGTDEPSKASKHAEPAKESRLIG